MILSPYKNDLTGWLRGNLHTHTTNSDGPLSPQQTIDHYAALGYNFLMISDHDMISGLAHLDPKGMTLVSGNEITANGCHMLHVGAKNVIAPDADRQHVIDQVNADGGFAIFCHPNWEYTFNHCPFEKLDQYQNFTGMEIFNGVTVWVEGNPYATDKWDRLLSNGKIVWGFADDDCHVPEDIGVACSMVQGDGDRSAQGIVEALRAGRFYAGTGVTITGITLDGRTICVQTAEAAKLVAVSDHGFRRMTTEGTSITFTIPQNPEYTYIRVECTGFGEKKAWTQPFKIQD